MTAPQNDLVELVDYLLTVCRQKLWSMTDEMMVALAAKGRITPAEVANVRAAIRFLRIRCGGWKSLAAALQLSRDTLVVAGRRGPVSPTTAFRVARLAGVPIDDVLAGRFPSPSACPYCGAGTPGEGA